MLTIFGSKLQLRHRQQTACGSVTSRITRWPLQDVWSSVVHFVMKLRHFMVVDALSFNWKSDWNDNRHTLWQWLYCVAEIRFFGYRNSCPTVQFQRLLTGRLCVPMFGFLLRQLLDLP